MKAAVEPGAKTPSEVVAADAPPIDLRADMPIRLRGRKGAQTRRRIMEATTAMLAERPFTDIRITDIARAANIAQPNFYTYFSSIDDLILALGKEVTADHLGVYLEPDWTRPDGLEQAMQLVEAAIEMWRRHRGMFSLVGNLADKRKGEFAAVRVRQMRTLYKSFERKIGESQAAGRIDPGIVPRLAGYECVSIIASMGQKYELLCASGFSHEELVGTTARMLHLLATGVKP
jgi:AcrR family transcriptional regulator